MSAKLIVGYRTRLVEGFEAFMPEFSAPSTYKDEEKRNKYVVEKQEEFKATAKDMPYTGTFDEVFLADPKNEQVMLWQYRQPGSGKQPIAVAIKAYLNKYWRDAWADDTQGKLPAAIFIGFNPRTFLKMLGLECTMPSVNQPLPLRLWYSNSDHRDIGRALIPEEFSKSIGLVEVVKARRPVEKDKEGRERWDRIVDGWTGPGLKPRQDAEVALELATQLGMLKD